MLLIKASARFPDLVQRAELEANIEVVAEVDGFRKGLLQSVSRTVVGGAGTRWATRFHHCQCAYLLALVSLLHLLRSVPLGRSERFEANHAGCMRCRSAPSPSPHIILVTETGDKLAFSSGPRSLEKSGPMHSVSTESKRLLSSNSPHL